jgi:streptogramin lyase
MTTEIFTTAGAFNWTPPEGVTKVTIELWGGGGAGGGGTSTSAYGGGGGGGEYARWVDVACTPLTAYSGTIGAAGTGGTGAGNPGGDTTITIGANTYTARRGAGGATAASAASATGGAGGTVSHTPAATQAVAGGTGATAVSGSTGGGGGQSGGPGGAGTNPTGATAGVGNTTTGVGGYSSSNGGAGAGNSTGGSPPAASGTRTTGGGGGGVYRTSSSRSGGAGTKGWAAFTYTPPVTLTITGGGASHAQVAQGPLALTQVHHLTVADGFHAHTVENIDIVQNVPSINLVVQNAAHATTTWNIGSPGPPITLTYTDMIGGAERFIIGPDGSMWYTDIYAPHQVVRLSTDGVATPIVTTGGSPYGICNGPDGNVWVAGYTGGTVYKISPAGALLATYTPGSGAWPFEICAGPDGNLWFGDYSSNGRIWRITPSGTATPFTVAGVTAAIRGICAGPDGRIWGTAVEARSNQLVAMTTDGVGTVYTIGEASLGSICVGPDGNLWAADNANQNAITVWKITTGGSGTQYSVSTTGFGGSTGGAGFICVGPDGNLWVTSTNGTIAQITLSGVITPYVLDLWWGLRGAIAGPDGNLWVSDYDNARIYKVVINKDLIQVHNLTVVDAVHSHTAQGPLALTQVHNLMVQGSSHVVVDNFSAPIIPGYGFRVDASQITGVADGASLDPWPDASGNGHPALSTGQAPKYYKTTGGKLSPTGLPMVWFTAASVQSLAVPVLSIAQPDTIYVVGKFSTVSPARTIFDSYVGHQGLSSYNAGNGGTDEWDIWAPDDTNPGHLKTDTNFHVWAVVFNGANSSLTVDNVTGSGVNPGANPLNGLYIGQDSQSGTWFDGPVAEVLVYSGVHTPAQIAANIASLTSKWAAGVSPGLTQVYNLGVANVSHATSAESKALTQLHQLVVANSSHLTVVGVEVLTQTHNLTVANSTHIQTAGSLVITRIHNLVVQDSIFSTVSSNVVVARIHNLVVADSGHATSSIVAMLGFGLTVNSDSHSVVSDSTTLTQVHNLSVQNGAHGLVSTSIGMIGPRTTNACNFDGTDGNTWPSPDDGSWYAVDQVIVPAPIRTISGNMGKADCTPTVSGSELAMVNDGVDLVVPVEAMVDFQRSQVGNGVMECGLILGSDSVTAPANYIICGTITGGGKTTTYSFCVYRVNAGVVTQVHTMTLPALGVALHTWKTKARIIPREDGGISVQFKAWDPGNGATEPAWFWSEGSNYTVDTYWFATMSYIPAGQVPSLGGKYGLWMSWPAAGPEKYFLWDNYSIRDYPLVKAISSNTTHGVSSDNITLQSTAPVDLVVASSSHTQTAESKVFTQLHILTVAGSTSATVAGALVISRIYNLVDQGAVSVTASDNVVLARVYNLIVQNTAHVLASDSPKPVYILAPNGAVNAISSPNVALTQVHSLIVASATHVTKTDGPLALTQLHILSVAGTAQAQLVGATVLTQLHRLTIAGAVHSIFSDAPVPQTNDAIAPLSPSNPLSSTNVVLTQVHNLVIQPSSHGVSSLNVGLLLPSTLVMQGTVHASVSQVPVLTQLHILSVSGSAHVTIAPNVVVARVYNLIVQGAFNSTSNTIPPLGPVLVVSGASNGTSSANVALTQVHRIVVNDIHHATYVENVGLSAEGIITPADILNGISSPVIGLTQVHHLTVASGAHGLTTQNIAETQTHILQVSSSLNSTNSPNLNLSAIAYLELADSLHQSGSTSVNFMQLHRLTAASSVHHILTEIPVLERIYNLEISSVNHILRSPNVSFVAGAPKIWVNGSWQTKPIKVYSNEWKTVPLLRWTGEEWERV